MSHRPLISRDSYSSLCISIFPNTIKVKSHTLQAHMKLKSFVANKTDTPSVLGYIKVAPHKSKFSDF